MSLRRWNLKKVGVATCVALVLYVVLTGGYHDYEIEAIVNDAEPEVVWEYVADFSKMRVLNPTILNFHITSDSGNTHEWRYSVLYEERLSHWPHWLNTATAHYSVTKSMPGIVPQTYAIHSKHETCFFRGLYCLHSISDFSFTAIGTHTHCLEKIQYQCPPFLGPVCHRELVYQRKAVMHNLTTIFQRKDHSL